MDPLDLILVALIAVSAGGVAYALLYPSLSGDKRAEERQRALTERASGQRIERTTRDAGVRREQIAQTLKEIEEKRGARKKSLPDRLAHAGLDWKPARFYLISAVTGLLIGLLLFAMTGGSLIIAGLAAFTGALGLPNWALKLSGKTTYREIHHGTAKRHGHHRARYPRRPAAGRLHPGNSPPRQRIRSERNSASLPNPRPWA